jgi:Domain of unknown function (DUF4177)
MPIDVACRCGKAFKAKDEHAGLRAKCPACGATVAIPKTHVDEPSFQDGIGVSDLHEGLEEDRLGREREATLTDVWKVLNTIATSIGASLPNSASGAGQQREYKVITQKDKWFSGKFDPEKVEGVLNSYAKQGWALKGVATASIPGFAGGQREEIVIIMER